MPNVPAPAHLVLASRSPRRAQLLREAGYDFTQADPPFDDPPQPAAEPGCSAKDLAGQLAGQKALSLQDHIPPGAVILAADTICVGQDGQLIGQPKDRQHAAEMIRHFTQNAHQVVTGVALLTDHLQAPLILVDQSTVVLETLNDVQLDEYLDTDQWQGKAGGYNLFDRQAAGWPIQVQGDPTTVVGLPMKQLIPALAGLSIRPKAPADVTSKRNKTSP